VAGGGFEPPADASVHDRDAAMAHHERLGFTVRAYSGGGHGFASREGVDLL
jgi:hypothetical protein